MLEDTCEDQRSAVQAWSDALTQWPPDADPTLAREHELLRVRSRDVHEHIERVRGRVRRLEQSAEAGVQMHFSLLGQCTNDVMRMLTVLPVNVLPPNLIASILGMPFKSMPLIRSAGGFIVAAGLMVTVGGVPGSLLQAQALSGHGPR